MRLYVDLMPLALGFAELTGEMRARMPAELEIAAIEGALLVQGELMQLLPKGAGGVGGGAGLAGSVSWGTQRSGDGAIAEIGTPVEHAEYVEYGTRPHRPPVQPIQDWVEVKLGLSGASATSAAHAIAAGIAKRGTQAQPVWEPTFTRVQPELRAAVNRAIARLIGSLG